MSIRKVKGWQDTFCLHPQLVNLYDCQIGEDTRIGAFVEIGKEVVVGRKCKIQTGAFIPEGVLIGDEVFIGPNVTFCNVKYPMTGEKYKITVVNDRAVIGAGATILPGIIIGEGAIVGAGAVVTKDVREFTTVAGNPASVKYKEP